MNEEGKYYVSMGVPQDQENGKGQIENLLAHRWQLATVTAWA